MGTLSPRKGPRGRGKVIAAPGPPEAARRRAETSPLRENDFAESLVETAQAIILVLDTKGRIVHFNPYMEEVSGRRLAEVKGKDWFRTFLPEHDHEAIRAVFARAVADVRTWGNVNPIVTRAGDLREIEWYDKTLRDADGHVVGLLSVGHDITERRRVEQALRESKELFEKTFTSQTDAVFILDAGDPPVILDANPAAAQMFGYGHEEVLGQTTAFLHVDEAVLREFQEQLYPAIAKHGFFHLPEFRMKRKNGAVFPSEHSVAPLMNDDGNRIGWVSLVRDITERKRIEEERERLLHNMAERVKELRCMQRVARTVRERAALQEVFQDVVRDIPAGWQYPQITRAKVRYGGTEHVAAPFEETPWKLSSDILVKGEKQGTVEVYYVEERPALDEGPFLKEERQLIDSLAQTLGEAIEHGQAEEALRHTQKMEALGQLAGGVAHDFRNQLTVMKGYAEMLARGGLVAEDGREGLEEILGAVERSTALAGQLLAFSRREMIQPELIDAGDALAEMGRSLEHVLGEDIGLSIVRGPGRCRVRIDPGQLQQAIMNLALNARDAMPRGGTLRIETGCVELGDAFARRHPGAGPGPHAVVTVTDTGAGMDAETLKRIFDPFFTTKTGGGGTGLGLAMVYGFVRQSGGVIEADSEPGKGTTFRLCFPYAGEGERVPEPAAEHATPPRGTETVLLVEDEADGE